MTRLGRLIVILLTVFIAVLATIRLVIGRTHTPHPFLAGILTNPDGSPCVHPCLFGIEPGYVTRDQAIASLKNHAVTRDVTVLPFLRYNEDFYAEGGDYLSISFRPPWLVDLSILRPPNMPAPDLANSKWNSRTISLSEIFCEYGPPDYVQTSQSFLGATLFYINKHLTIVVDKTSPDRFRLNDLVFDYEIFNDKQLLLSPSSGLLPWQGFGNARYPDSATSPTFQPDLVH